jgi:hypothetical protein
MPVPEHAYFGPAEDGHGINYGQVRCLAEEEKLRALQRRFNHLLLGQVNELTRSEGGKRVVHSPFPLFIMTCVGIETAGKIFFSRVPGPGESEEDVQRLGFLEVCKGIHGRLSRPLAKEDKAGYDSLWGANEHKKVQSYAHIIYRFGRHTMIHGYRGKGVYFTDPSELPDWTMDGGGVVVNPYWFWGRFAEHSAELWERFYANKNANNPLKASARAYLHDLLG